TLAGTTTVNAVDGIATFADLSVDLPGSGYTLAVTASGLTGAASTAFAVHLTFATVSAGDNHTCGLTTSHAAYCWGAGGVQGGAATGGPLRGHGRRSRPHLRPLVERRGVLLGQQRLRPARRRHAKRPHDPWAGRGCTQFHDDQRRRQSHVWRGV